MTSFDRLGNLIVVTGTLVGPGGDARATLAVDTGATVTILSRSILARTGYNPLLGRSVTFFNTERSHAGTVLHIRRLDAINQSFLELEVVAQDLPPESGVDGLLGLNAFRDRRLVIDFRAGEIALD